MTDWNIDIASLPGPDRRRCSLLRDIVAASPDNRHLALVYACGEVGIMKEVGYLALLAGPPERPRRLLRPRWLLCNAGYREQDTVRWLDDRYCVVTSYQPAATLYLDTSRKTAAVGPSRADAPLPDSIPALTWRSWHWLHCWPWLWRLAGGRSDY